MQFWAFIVDSLRESRDSKIFWILIVLSSMVALAMASVGVEEERITFMFGLWEQSTSHYNPLSELGRSHLVGFTVYILLNSIMGWIGIILLIVATARVFPSFMQRGTVDVLLAKPLSRPTLFFYKYMAGLVFVAVQGTYFVVLTFLVMGLRWHVWAPGYLLSIPFLVLLFSYIYCVSVLVSVLTRSAIASILLSLTAWAAFALIHQQLLAVFEMVPSLKEHRSLYTTARVVAWIPPKTADFPYLVARWSQVGTSLDAVPSFLIDAKGDRGRAEFDMARKLEQLELEKNPWASIGSSLLFEAFVVLLAIWKFSRSDF